MPTVAYARTKHARTRAHACVHKTSNPPPCPLIAAPVTLTFPADLEAVIFASTAHEILTRHTHAYSHAHTHTTVTYIHRRTRACAQPIAQTLPSAHACTHVRSGDSHIPGRLRGGHLRLDAARDADGARTHTPIVARIRTYSESLYIHPRTRNPHALSHSTQHAHAHVRAPAWINLHLELLPPPVLIT